MTTLSILSICFFGYILSGIFVEDKFERISLSFVLGMGIFTLCWFLLNLLGVSYTLLSAFGLILVLTTLSFAISKIVHRKKKRIDAVSILTYFKNMCLVEKVVMCLIFFLLVSSLSGDLFWPVRHWDSLTLYDFRAKIMASTGSMANAISFGSFFGYPLLTSLSHTIVYLSGSTNPTFIYNLFYISLIANIFVNFKKFKLDRTLILFLTLIVAISPRIFDHSMTAYTNLPYTIYLVLGSIYLYWGIKNENLGEYTVSAFLIGLSTWTRSAEPYWLTYIVLAITFSLLIKKWIWPFIYTISFGFILFPWRIFISSYNQGSSNIMVDTASTSQRLIENFQISLVGPVLGFMMKNVVEMYLFYFLLLVVIVVIKLISKSKEWLFIILIILNLGLTFAGTTYFAIFTPYWKDIPDSLSRMVLFIPILIIFFTAELLTEMKNGKITNLKQ